MNNEKKDIAEVLTEVLQKIHDEKQSRPDQYVVAYKRKSDDSLIGYHLSTFCQITDDILRGKRYSGESPDKQLAIIWNNFKSMMATTEEDSKKKGLAGIFQTISYNTKTDQWKDINIEDVYIDVVYLAEGTEKQPLSVVVVKGDDDSAIIK